MTLTKTSPILIALLGALACGPAFETANTPRPAATRPATVTPAQRLPTETSPPVPTATEAQPTGKIVFTCQLAADSRYDQICLMDPDGSSWQLVTKDPDLDHFYPSLAPSGAAVVYSSNAAGGYDIYETNLESGQTQRRTFQQDAYAPAISPDGSRLVFTVIVGEAVSLWLANRDGSAPHPVTAPAWDAAWSPDGAWILHASDRGGENELWRVRPDGSDLRRVLALDGLRGRSDWSPTGNWLATYAGPSWERELFLFDPEGGNLRQLTDGGNNLAPSFSPSGRWLAYTSYRDNYREDNGCEIYTLEVGTGRIQRLTDNSYCDWQPRWGP